VSPKQHSPAGKRLKQLVQGPRWPELFEHVPPRDLNFTGREEALTSLHRLLMQAQRPAAITQAAVHGLGGMGKTTLAAEYAHRHAGEYAGVWWAPAETRSGLLASLVELAARLEPRLTAEGDQQKAARAGLAHLARSAVPYLLVYDNVETPEVLRDLVPSAGARVILTTRWADWSGPCRGVGAGGARV
jgi:AAA ATPase-like protein